MIEKVKFDGLWVVSSDTTRRLRDAGYMVGVYATTDGHGYMYTLHNQELAYGLEKMRWPTVFETADPDELNNVIKLLITD